MVEKKGCVINGYELLRDFTETNAGRCQWSFAYKDGREYYIKKFTHIVFPLPDSSGSAATKEYNRKLCDKFFSQQMEVFDKLKEYSKGGNLIVAIDFFLYGRFYYKVTSKVDFAPMSIEQVSSLDIDDKLLLLKTLTNSVAILHNKINLVHGDIKPDNILLHKTQEGKKFVAKLIDFDDSYESGKLPLEAEDLVYDQVYQSPELALYMDKQITGENITTKSDIFALGLIFTQYLTGCMPGFNKEKYHYAAFAVLNSEKLFIPDIPGYKKSPPSEPPQSPPAYKGSLKGTLLQPTSLEGYDHRVISNSLTANSDWLSDLLDQMLQKDPNLRPTIDQVFQSLKHKIKIAPIPPENPTALKGKGLKSFSDYVRRY